MRAISSFGCITTAPFTVELESTPPDITCPGNQTLFALAGSCEVSLPDYVDSAVVSDNCNLVNGITITQKPAAGTLIADHGTIQEVWLIATDEAGNSDSCAFNVTLNDTINPSINNLPGNISVNNDNNQCGAVVTWVEPSSADNCSGHSISQTSGPSNNTLFPIGETTIIYTASDAAGNTSLDSFMVTVTDNEKPTISCPIDITQDMDEGECVANVTYTAPTGSDNCSGSNTTQTAGLASGSDFPIGVTTNTFLVTDAYGNSDSCSFTVTITDNEDPVIIDLPSDITVSAIDGGCDSIVSWNQPSFSDNCSGGSITQVAGLASGSNFPIGLTWIKYEARDNVGNVVQDSFLVTVLDSEDPTISCPSDITSAAGLDSCSKTLVIPDITFDDNCTGSALTWETTGSTVISGSGQPGTQTFELGTTTLELTVTDASTNTKSCSLDVVIDDEQVPSIVCPSTMAMDATSGLCTKDTTIPTIVFSDNCSGASLVWEMSGATVQSGSGQPGLQIFNVGTTSIELIATDTALNRDTCNFDVVVEDNEKPVILNCPENITRTSSSGSCTATVSWTEPTATDNCTISGSLVKYRSHSPGSTFSVGSTQIKYAFTDAAGNISDTCSFNVIVTDDQKPVISGCPTDITVNAIEGQCGATVSWTEPTVSDNCTSVNNIQLNSTASSGDFFPSGTTTVTYEAIDESSNISLPCSFDVIVIDSVDPVASCKADTIYVNNSGIASVVSANINNNSSDNCTSDEDLIFSVSKSSFSCSDLGDKTITLSVKDGSGNESTCDAIVTVADSTAPVLTATSGTVTGTVNTTNGQCHYTVNGSVFDPIVSDNCSGTVTLNYSVSGQTTISGTGSLANVNLNVGVNTIVWTATDASGNTSSESITFTKTVLDNQAPVIAAKANQTRNTNTDCGYTTVGTEFDISASDNCGSLTLSYEINDSGTPVVASTLDGVIFNAGINKVVWTASDGTNTSTRSFRITVIDDDAPTITGTSNITQNVDEGLCTATVTWPDPVANDNCGLASFNRIEGPASGSSFPIGITTIKYKAIDLAGLTVTKTFTVTVFDGTAPEITCPSGSTELNPFERDAETGLCYYTVSGTEFDPTVTDGCPDNLVITNDFDGSTTLAGKHLPAEEHTIVWTADDGSNTSTCTIYVSVTDTEDPTYTQPTGVDSSFAYNRTTDPGKCYYTVPGTGFDLQNLDDNCSTETPTYIIFNDGDTAFTGSNSLAGLQIPKDANEYSVHWKLSDVNGRIVIPTPFTISVVDDEAPSFTCYGNETRSIPDTVCKYIVDGTEFDPIGLSDNCDVVGDLDISYSIDGVPGSVVHWQGLNLLVEPIQLFGGLKI